MEYKAALVVFLVEFIAGIWIFVRQRRSKSEFGLAREEFWRSLKLHLIEGTLARQLEDIAAGKVFVYERKKSLAIYLWTGISMVLGVAFIFLLARFTGAGLILRTIAGSLAILPFIYFVVTAIAEEFDDNRISNFERTTARQLLLKSQEGSIDSEINEMLQ
jgi:hypothetical protein